MKRSRKDSHGAAPGSVAPIPKMPLAPVRRVYLDIVVEVLPEQAVDCQDAGCKTRAALRVGWHDSDGLNLLLLCAYHAQVTVARLRERRRLAMSTSPPAQAPPTSSPASVPSPQAPAPPPDSRPAYPVAPSSADGQTEEPDECR